jgi:DNA-binding transcriptional ArsR family regulator
MGKSTIITQIRSKFSEQRCSQISQLMAVLSNPVRFHILCALRYQPFTVSELVELTEARVSNVSQQLKMMLLAGYLAKERRGKQIYYKLQEQRIALLLNQLETLYPK